MIGFYVRCAASSSFMFLLLILNEEIRRLDPVLLYCMSFLASIFICLSYYLTGVRAIGDYFDTICDRNTTYDNHGLKLRFPL